MLLWPTIASVWRIGDVSKVRKFVPMSIEQYDEGRKKVCRDPDMVYRCNQWGTYLGTVPNFTKSMKT